MPTTSDATDVTRSSVHLDAIRGAAALVVLLGHTRDLFFSSVTAAQPAPSSAQQSLSQGPSTPANPRITIGNEAVMIFFVLSGYLVGGSALKALKRNTWSWKNYLTKRLTRLWVVLIPALILGVAFDHIGLHFFLSPTSIYAGPAQQSLVTNDLLHHLSLPVIAGNFVFLQSILVVTAGTNDSLWSLTNEFWYYVAFPVLLLAFRRHQTLWLRCLYLAIAASIVLLVHQSISRLFFIWVLGALLSLVPLTTHRTLAKALSATLTLLLPVAFVTIRRSPLPIYAAEWIVALYFAFTLYFILHQTGKAPAGLYSRIAGFFSRISYTLYLVHLPLAVLLCACINNPWHRWPKSPRNLFVFLLLNIFLVGVSYLSYSIFEANTDRVRHAIFHRRIKEKFLPA